MSLRVQDVPKELGESHPVTWTSKVSERDEPKIREDCQIPDSVQLRFDTDRVGAIVEADRNEAYVYMEMFRIGLRLPFPRIVRELLSYIRIAPHQLASNAWRLRKKKKLFTFRRTYSSNHGWNEELFFAQGDWEFSPSEVIRDPSILRETTSTSNRGQQEPRLTLEENKRVKDVLDHAELQPLEMDYDVIMTEENKSRYLWTPAPARLVEATAPRVPAAKVPRRPTARAVEPSKGKGKRKAEDVPLKKPSARPPVSARVSVTIADEPEDPHIPALKKSKKRVKTTAGKNKKKTKVVEDSKQTAGPVAEPAAEGVIEHSAAVTEEARNGSSTDPRAPETGTTAPHIKAIKISSSESEEPNSIDVGEVYAFLGSRTTAATPLAVIHPGQTEEGPSFSHPEVDRTEPSADEVAGSGPEVEEPVAPGPSVAETANQVPASAEPMDTEQAFVQEVVEVSEDEEQLDADLAATMGGVAEEEVGIKFLAGGASPHLGESSQPVKSEPPSMTAESPLEPPINTSMENPAGSSRAADSSAEHTPEPLFWNFGEPLTRLGDKWLANPFALLAGAIPGNNPVEVNTQLPKEVMEHMPYHQLEVIISPRTCHSQGSMNSMNYYLHYRRSAENQAREAENIKKKREEAEAEIQRLEAQSAGAISRSQELETMLVVEPIMHASLQADFSALEEGAIRLKESFEEISALEPENTKKKLEDTEAELQCRAAESRINQIAEELETAQKYSAAECTRAEVAEGKLKTTEEQLLASEKRRKSAKKKAKTAVRRAEGFETFRNWSKNPPEGVDLNTIKPEDVPPTEEVISKIAMLGKEQMPDCKGITIFGFIPFARRPTGESSAAAERPAAGKSPTVDLEESIAVSNEEWDISASS
ncbi:uncharacterized protein LOC132169884 [Corylus avellana]|uniref:uncharacterized protein LOC132169884 n=1 Tax=Corylus avellana TaxID=13451 RepID=UPI00286B9897|nr:uncharacterized protein LOC132169884 [Corylus avellana]